MDKEERIGELIKVIKQNPTPAVNTINKTMQACYVEAKYIFTDDLLLLSERVKKSIDANRKKDIESIAEKLAENIDNFMHINFPSLKQGSAVIKRAFYSDGSNTPSEIKSFSKLSKYDKSSLIFKEEAISTHGDNIARFFLLKKKNDVYFPKRIDKEALSDFLQRNKTEVSKEQDGKDAHQRSIEEVGESVFLEDTYLIVPFEEKGEAKINGAKWDAKNSLWYAPKGATKKNFTKWYISVQQERVRQEYEAISSVGSSGRHPEEEFKEILDQLNLEHGNTIEFVDYATFRSARAKPLKEKGSRKSNMPGSYKIAIDPMGFYYGWAKNNHTGQYVTYNQRNNAELKKISAEARYIDEQIIKVNAIIGEREEKRILEEAITRCNKEYGEFIPVKKTEEHEYLIDKKIDPYPFIRRKRKTIMIPLYDLVTGKMVSYQKIGKIYNDDKGKWEMKKRLAWGGKKEASALLVSRSAEIKTEDLDILFVAEGFSTAASIEKALNHPVFMSIDAGNLPKVTKLLSVLYPEKRIVVVADNDYGKVLRGMDDPTLNQKQKENTGLLAAQKAHDESDADYIVPEFSEEDLRSGLSDANDIHCKYGIDALRKQLVEKLRDLRADITWSLSSLKKEDGSVLSKKKRK